jgi:hypothetical protein
MVAARAAARAAAAAMVAAAAATGAAAAGLGEGWRFATPIVAKHTKQVRNHPISTRKATQSSPLTSQICPIYLT